MLQKCVSRNFLGSSTTPMISLKELRGGLSLCLCCPRFWQKSSTFQTIRIRKIDVCYMVGAAMLGWCFKLNFLHKKWALPKGFKVIKEGVERKMATPDGFSALKPFLCSSRILSMRKKVEKRLWDCFHLLAYYAYPSFWEHDSDK